MQSLKYSYTANQWEGVKLLLTGSQQPLKLRKSQTFCQFQKSQHVCLNYELGMLSLEQKYGQNQIWIFTFDAEDWTLLLLLLCVYQNNVEKHLCLNNLTAQ